MFYFSPLEQFNILYFYKLLFINISISNMSIYLIIIFCGLIFILLFGNISRYFIGLFELIFEFFYYFILDILNQQTHEKGLKYYPFYVVIFYLILFLNLYGLLPFSFTLTAHLCITFFFALSFNISFFLIGIFLYKIKFFYPFVPQGAPKYLLPLIVIIEIGSYFIRTFSLSIRLFANMMAGHRLLYVISSFVFTLVYLYKFYIILFIFILYFLILCLEFAVAFLQTYVFTILLSIYLNDSLHPIH